jgi:hypothetical protein
MGQPIRDVRFAPMCGVEIDVCFVPIADIEEHQSEAISSLLQLFDLPRGLVADDTGRVAAGRVVKLHHSVGDRSRDTLIFPCTTYQIMVFVIEGREYVVTIFVSFNAATVEVKCLPHQGLVSEAANRHVMERAFSFNIAGDSSDVHDCPRAGSAIDFCYSGIHILCVVFRAASFRKLRG